MANLYRALKAAGVSDLGKDRQAEQGVDHFTIYAGVRLASAPDREPCRLGKTVLKLARLIPTSLPWLGDGQAEP